MKFLITFYYQQSLGGIGTSKIGAKKNTKTVQEYKQNIIDFGFAVINNIFSADEVEQIVATIHQADTSSPAFRKSTDLFAIRQFLKEIPATRQLIFTAKLNGLVK